MAVETKETVLSILYDHGEEIRALQVLSGQAQQHDQRVHNEDHMPS